MPPALTSETENLIETLIQEVQAPFSPETSSWQLLGPRTTGKTFCLRELERRLRESSKLCPVLVSPPVKDWDTGLVALTQVAIASGLRYGRAAAQL